MRPGLKPLAMSSAALVGASLIATAPPTAALTPPLPEHAKAQISDVAVRLAANSIANIPTNLFRILADIPMNQLIGINAASESLEGSGNWWIYTPTNALGWDQMDYAKAVGFTKMFTPIPEVAQAQADQLNAIMARNFPMTRSCTGIPGPCADPYYFTAYFSTPPLEAIFGYSYTFGDVFNSIDQSIEMPWSNQTLTYDPFGPGKALWQALTKDPEEDWEYQPTFLAGAPGSHHQVAGRPLQLLQPLRRRHLLCALPVARRQGSTELVAGGQHLRQHLLVLSTRDGLTDQDSSQPHPEMPAAPCLKKLPLLLSPRHEHRINSDAKVYFNSVFKGSPIRRSEMEEPHNTPAIPAPLRRNQAVTFLVASTVDSEVTADETTKVTETAPRTRHPLFTLDLGAAKKAPKLAAGETTTEATPVTGTDTEEALEQPSTTPSEEEAQPSPRKRFTDPFKPWGSSKQRADAQAKQAEKVEAKRHPGEAESAEAAASRKAERADAAARKSGSDDSKKDAA